MKATPLCLYGCLVIMMAHPLYATEKQEHKHEASKSEPAKSEPAKSEPGQTLHEGNCVRCHDTQLYLRDNRKMKSLDSLQNQVQTCVTNLGLTWFEDEVNAVSNYLNTHYYKFSPKK